MNAYSYIVILGSICSIASVSLVANSSNVASAAPDLHFKMSQALKQDNLCADNSDCSNTGVNVAAMIKSMKQKIYAKIHQQLEQHNICVHSECINEGYNGFMIDKIKGKLSSSINQKIEQTNECDNSQCINEGGNEITVNDGKINSDQIIIQSNVCGDHSTCINSAGNVILVGSPGGDKYHRVG